MLPLVVLQIKENQNKTQYKIGGNFLPPIFLSIKTKMKNILIVLVAFTLFSCGVHKSQKPTAVKDTSGNLVGIAVKSSFLQAPYNNWFSENYEDYKVDKETVKKLKPLLKGVTIKAFMGTWCGDSKQETPVFYKILDDVSFNYNRLQMVAVNRQKKTPDNLQKGLHIKRVPTFIFYKKGKEIGRFVEYPVESMEKDFVKILSGQNYKHPYSN